jgi:hypothetical protein
VTRANEAERLRLGVMRLREKPHRATGCAAATPY